MEPDGPSGKAPDGPKDASMGAWLPALRVRAAASIHGVTIQYDPLPHRNKKTGQMVWIGRKVSDTEYECTSAEPDGGFAIPNPLEAGIPAPPTKFTVAADDLEEVEELVEPMEIRFIRWTDKVGDWERWPRARVLALRDQYDRDKSGLEADVQHVQYRQLRQTGWQGFGPGPAPRERGR